MGSAFRISGSLSPRSPLTTRDPLGIHLTAGGVMLAQVSIDAEGAVTVSVDSDEAEDDESTRLAGLVLDDMLERARATAVETWNAVHIEAAGDECA